MSFAFKDLNPTWEPDEDGTMVRHLKKVRLFDVSVTTYPAYLDTDVAVRSLKEWRNHLSEPDNETRMRCERAQQLMKNANLRSSVRKGDHIVEIQTLKEERAHTVRTMNDMTNAAKKDARSLSKDEQKEFDALEKKAADYDEAIMAAEETEERAQRASKRMEDLMTPEKRRTPYPSHRPQPVEDDEFPAFDRRFMKFGQTQVFTKDNFGADADKLAYRAGMWACAAILNRSHAQRWCREHGIDLETRALATNVNTAGGVLVPDEMEQAIIIMREEYGVARSECRTVPMGSDTMLMPRWTDGLTHYYVGENAAITQSQPSFDQVRLTARKLATLTPFSTELRDDAIINIGDFLATEIAREFAKAEDAALFNGDGTSTYGGIKGARLAISENSNLVSWVEAAQPHDEIPEVDIDDLLPMMAVLPEHAQANAKWFVSPAFWNLVMLEIMEAGGGQTFATYQAGPTGRSFLGYPCVVSTAMPNGITTSYDAVTMAIFGDMRQAAYLGDRRGVSIFASDQRYLEFDQVGVRGTQRYDINVHGIGNTTTAGPIVGLIGNIA
jgi:HK97 family phage major capsid protein